MRYWAIINPSSGNGRTARLLDVVLDNIKDIISGHTVARYPGHCKEVALQCRGSDGIIAVGGDGTVCEVINGMDLDRQTLAIIPTGTGNSLARDFGIRSIESAAVRVRQQSLSRMDLLHFAMTDVNGGRREWLCSSTASIGYGARVSEMANKRLKRLGALCYPAASIACALRLEFICPRVSYDGGPTASRRLTGMMLQNARHAGNFEVTPQASIRDGLLDVVELNAGCVRQSLHNISVLSGLHFYRPFSVRIAAKMHILPDTPMSVMIDGDILTGIADIDIQVLPNRLTCCF